MLKEDILNQLRRILESYQLVNSVVLTEFLTFVVTETLAGRADSLKEYTIGIQALKKDADFNPQIDSIVRIHAGRLRRALKEYYYEAGKNDPIIISIPKGNYTPVFRSRENEIGLFAPAAREPAEAAKADETLPAPMRVLEEVPSNFVVLPKPTVAVVPFRNIGSEEDVLFFANGLREYLNAELTRFQQIRVVSAASKGAVPNDTLPPDFVLSGSVQWLKGHIRLWMHLDVVETKEQLWAQTFEKSMAVEDYWKFQEEVVNKALAWLMGLNGVISRHQVERVHPGRETPTSYPLHYWYYAYIRNFDLETVLMAKAFYSEVVRRMPEHAQAFAYLSQISSGEKPVRMMDFEKSLDDGLLYAHQAIRLDPQCQEGYMALAINFMLREDFAGATRTLEQGLAINPRSVDYQGAMGALLIFMGEYDRGKTVLDQAFNLMPHLPWWQVLAFGYHAFYHEHYQDAIFWAERIEMTSDKIRLIKAAAYAHQQQFDKAFESLAGANLLVSEPELLSEASLARLFTHKPMIEKVRRGLRKLLQNRRVGAVGSVFYMAALL